MTVHGSSGPPAQRRQEDDSHCDARPWGSLGRALSMSLPGSQRRDLQKDAGWRLSLAPSPSFLNALWGSLASVSQPWELVGLVSRPSSSPPLRTSPPQTRLLFPELLTTWVPPSGVWPWGWRPLTLSMVLSAESSAPCPSTERPPAIRPSSLPGGAGCITFTGSSRLFGSFGHEHLRPNQHPRLQHNNLLPWLELLNYAPGICLTG